MTLPVRGPLNAVAVIALETLTLSSSVSPLTSRVPLKSTAPATVNADPTLTLSSSESPSTSKSPETSTEETFNFPVILVSLDPAGSIVISPLVDEKVFAANCKLPIVALVGVITD